MIRALTLSIAMALVGLPAAAQSFDNLVSGELRPGWRRADGTHVAALHLTLAPGWKTYWRAPGEAGIPPVFDWSASGNLSTLGVVWPVPHVFEQSGMQAVGYSGELVLPITVQPKNGGDVMLEGDVQIGICNDICLPRTLRVRGLLAAGQTRPDPMIAAAMASRPLSAAEAGVRAVRCRVSPVENGLALEADVTMPSLGRDESAVIETDNPEIWVSEAEEAREGDTLHAAARLVHMEGGALALDRSGVRITVLGGGQAVDIRGCAG